MSQHQQSLVAGRQLPPGTQTCPVGLQHVSPEGQGALGQRDGAGLAIGTATAGQAPNNVILQPRWRGSANEDGKSSMPVMPATRKGLTGADEPTVQVDQ